jgi:hypothetical protein
MNKSIIALGICLLVLTCPVFALQKAFLYVTLGYGRGWWGWACVTEKGMKGVHGYPKDFCGARDCPFEAAIALGENNCINKDMGDETLFSEDVLKKGATLPATYGAVVRINIQENLKLVRADGTVVSDEVCIGESLKLQKGAMKGEYLDDGGNMDTPPILWVDDVEALTKKILDYHERTTITCKDVSQKSVPDGFVDSLTGIAVYEQSASQVTGRLVCSLKDVQLGSSGQVSGTGGTFKVTAPGTASIQASYSVLCMYYQYGTPGGCMGNIDAGVSPSSGGGFAVFRLPMVLQNQPLPPGGGKLIMYINEHPDVVEQVIDVPAGFEEFPLTNVYAQNIIFNSMDDFFKIGNISLSKNLKVVSPVKTEVELEVVGAKDIKFGENNNLRVLVKNNAGTDIKVTNMRSKAGGKLVSCDKETIPVGAAGECVFSVVPKSDAGLDVQVSYEYKSCGKTLVGAVTKTILSSEVIKASSFSQVYSMDVHGDCENMYYACYSGDDRLFAGYRCFNKGDNFYTSGAGRFDLGFDLSKLPVDLDILSASIKLSVSGVAKEQNVAVVYFQKKGVPSVVCAPGGDICTQPYCPECKQLFDVEGSVVSDRQIKTPGAYSFDVTGIVKNAYAGESKNLSFQFKGDESVWENEGKVSCASEGVWNLHDIEFQGKGGSEPYLEIVYK